MTCKQLKALDEAAQPATGFAALTDVSRRRRVAPGVF